MPTRPRVNTTHTSAELELSPAAYGEIAGKLRAAEYHHAFADDQPGAAIDMHGIAVTRQPTLICKSCTQEYALDGKHECPGLQPKQDATDALMGKVGYVMSEKRSAGSWLVTVGFPDRQSADDFHQWVAHRSTKAAKAGT